MLEGGENSHMRQGKVQLKSSSPNQSPNLLPATCVLLAFCVSHGKLFRVKVRRAIPCDGGGQFTSGNPRT